MQKPNQKFRFGKILLALLFVVVGFTSQTNAATSTLSECPVSAKATLDAGYSQNLPQPNNQVLFRNLYGEIISKSACRAYCESKGGIFTESGWYIYCNKTGKAGDSLASECPDSAKATFDKGITEDLPQPNNQVLFKNIYGETIDAIACKAYCENRGGVFTEEGWYLYCNKGSLSEVAGSGKAAGANADPAAKAAADANAADATAAAKAKAAAAVKTGNGSTAGTKTGDSSTSTGEVIPPADNRYFEVGVQTPFSAAPINADGTQTPAGEKILVAKWIADGYKQCDSSATTNSGCDFRCVWQKGNKGLCENLTSGEAWRFIPADGGETGKWQQVIRGSDGIDILTTYTTLIYRWLAGFIGIAAVLLIVIGGIMISSAGANQEGMESGKKLITSALAGLTLLFVSSLILYTVNPDFFLQTTGVKEFEKEIAITSTTTPAAGAGAGAKTAAATKVAIFGTYTHAEALAKLNSNFTVKSTAGDASVCADVATCKTSLTGIQQDVVNGANELFSSCGGSGKWVITGGSETTSHASASDAHGLGYALDMDTPNYNLESCFSKDATAGKAVGSYPTWKKTVGGYKYYFIDERTHIGASHIHVEVNSANANAA